MCRARALLCARSSGDRICCQDQNIELLFYRLDLNHDGVIDLDEFIGGYDQYLNLLQTGSFLTTTRDLKVKAFLRTDDPIPRDCESVDWRSGNVRLYKSTYPANDPSEDRSTVVVGDDFIFAGVWDGAPPAHTRMALAISDTALCALQATAAHSALLLRKPKFLITLR